GKTIHQFTDRRYLFTRAPPAKSGKASEASCIYRESVSVNSARALPPLSILELLFVPDPMSAVSDDWHEHVLKKRTTFRRIELGGEIPRAIGRLGMDSGN